ncbi:thioesterase II family protein [Embleya sp. NPDC020886]|uniref:thioesterase II family protein n=1 Tax=Embleya sp. NPDC020886 TaxID=3363980 RepID=UPI003789B6E8
MPVTRRNYCLRTLTDAPVTPAAPQPVARLVCLPHSGGTAAAYAPWAASLRPDIELLAVQYPGHGDRFGEPAPDDVRTLSAELDAELSRLDPLPTFLFGHSLGALVAYESALALAADGRPLHGLLVSGCLPPSRQGGGRTHLCPDEELWSVVCRMGGVDPEIADNPDLAQVLLPVLRADITAHERYRPAARATPLRCPVRCHHGAQDPLVDGTGLAGWDAVGTGTFSLLERPGGHFHPFRDPAGLVAEILAFIDAALDFSDSRTRSQPWPT